MDIFLVMMLVISGVYLILLSYIACVENFREAMLFKFTPLLFGLVLIGLGLYVAVHDPLAAVPMPTAVVLPLEHSIDTSVLREASPSMKVEK